MTHYYIYTKLRSAFKRLKKCCYAWKIICIIFVNEILLGKPFAKYLHTLFYMENHLQSFGKRNSVKKSICRVSANVILLRNMFAELLQMQFRWEIYLPNFCKQFSFLNNKVLGLQSVTAYGENHFQFQNSSILCSAKRAVAMIAVILLPLMSANAQEPTNLREYILHSLEKNEELRAMFYKYKAAEDAAQGSGQLQQPELSVGILPKAMHGVNSKQTMTVELMQMFPWWGVLKNERKAMSSEAQAEYQRFRGASIELAYKVQMAWWDMLVVKEQVKSVSEQLEVLHNVEQTTLYLYKQGSAMGGKMSDQLRIKSEIAGMEERKASLTADLDLKKKQFNLLIQRSAWEEIVLPDTIKVEELRVIDLKNIWQEDPQMLSFQHMEDSYKAQEKKARAEGAPMFSVGVQYMVNGKVDNPQMPSMNGMDMWMPMVKMSVPIYRKKTNANVKKARHLQESVKGNMTNRKSELASEYFEIQKAYEDAIRKTRLYNEQCYWLRNTIDLMTSEYVNGKVSLTDILQTSREMIALELQWAEARAEANKIVARMEKLEGFVPVTTKEENLHIVHYYNQKK